MIKGTIRKRLTEFQQREKKTAGFLGRADGTVRVPGKTHWVYVSLWNGEIIEAFNSGNVPVSFGLAVLVTYRGGRYYIAPRDVYDQPVYVGLPDGAEEELQWPGLHTLYVRPEQFLPGAVIPKTDMTVYVYGGSLPLPSGGYVTIPTRELDLTPYLPATNAHWLTIGWNVDGTIATATGGAANSCGELKEDEIPTTSGYDLAAVKLFNGQTVISHGKFGSVIMDLRFFKPGSVATSWGSITGTLSNQLDLQNILDNKQPLNADLTAIAELSPANDDIIQRKSGTWTNRTVSQFAVDLSPLLNKAFQRNLMQDLTLENGECMLVSSYINTNGHDIVMPAEGDCELRLI